MNKVGTKEIKGKITTAWAMRTERACFDAKIPTNSGGEEISHRVFTHLMHTHAHAHANGLLWPSDGPVVAFLCSILVESSYHKNSVSPPCSASVSQPQQWHAWALCRGLSASPIHFLINGRMRYHNVKSLSWGKTQHSKMKVEALDTPSTIIDLIVTLLVSHRFWLLIRIGSL